MDLTNDDDLFYDEPEDEINGEDDRDRYLPNDMSLIIRKPLVYVN